MMSGTRKSTTALFLGAILAALWVVVTVSGPPAQAKDDPEDFTRVYRHTYDEVWDATHDAIERKGWFVTDDDKDKGIIRGNAPFGHWKATFEVHIETVSSKPETRVTINSQSSGVGSGTRRKVTAAVIFEETQKVLSTYK